MKIICGPALRRVEKDVIYIWLLTDERPQKINVYADVSETFNENTQIAKGAVEGVDIKCFGEHLYAALIAVKPSDNKKFPPDKKIFYNIEINGSDLTTSGVGKLISGDKPIVYGEDDIYPSFYIPTKHQKIIQGSCRKPHAAKDHRVPLDQINKIDFDIETSFSEIITKRPSMLCLTGDQIYADDVTVSLASMLKKEAEYLTGWKESLPSSDGLGAIFPAELKLGKRNDALAKNNGFTSAHTHNHLMSFGEYVAMYIAAWSEVVSSVPKYTDVTGNMGTEIKKIKRGNKISFNKTVAIYDSDEYSKSKSLLELFLKNNWKMRRIMANTVTYMIFDDHEVTDDWNLTEENQRLLRENPLARRIQANALAAYWLFQGWGNNPNDDDFSDEFINTISDFVQSQTHENGSDFEDALLAKKYWGYEVAGYPYLTVLDTRSDRSFAAADDIEDDEFEDDEEENEVVEVFSQLMSEERLEDLGHRFKDINTKYGDQQSMLIMSPAPILGFRSVEYLQLLFDFIPNTIDGEPWVGSPVAYDNLCKALKNIKFKHCSVFSGDVHYSFARRQTLERKDDANGPLLLNQYTSSALYNWPSGIARLALDTLSDIEKVAFRKNNTPYLFPNKPDDTYEFLSGHPSYGLLEFENGIPIRNTYYFNYSDNINGYDWEYEVANPQVLRFEDFEDVDEEW